MKISANGITLHAEESGAGDIALIFLHYWGGTARSWAPAIAALPGTCRAIALDARGWGGSDRPAAGYDIATMADDVEAAQVVGELPEAHRARVVARRRVTEAKCVPQIVVHQDAVRPGG